MSSFLESIAGVLETPSVRPDDKFREVEGWSSLMAFGLLVTMENEWNAPMTVDDLAKCETVRDLFCEAFAAFAAGVLGVSRETARGASFGSIPEWDSVNHLRLVMEAEPRFGVAYPLEEIPGMRSAPDFLR